MRLAAKATAAVAVMVGLAGTMVAGQEGRRTAARGEQASDGTLVVQGALEWLQRSDLSAEREGVLDDIYFDDGGHVQKGQEIGRLRDDVARLNVEKQELIANSEAAIRKASAQREQAATSLARYENLFRKGYSSREEVDKGRADLNYADALVLEANDKQKTDRKELELVKKALEQHRIISPFNGVIIKRHKNPGEAVQANEPVVRIGNTDKFKFMGWMSLESSLRVRTGDRVTFLPSVEGAELAIERKQYQGKVLAVGSEIPQVPGNAEVSVTAEIDNPFDAEHEELLLLQGLKGDLTITPAVPAGAKRTANRPAADSAVNTTSKNR